MKDNNEIIKPIDVIPLSSSLKERLVDDVNPLITKLKIAVKGNVAEELSSLLITLGEEYEIQYLKKKGMAFKEAVECFDILKINEYIIQLEKWLSEIMGKGSDI